MSWVLGDVLDLVAGIVDPANPALIHGDRVLTWADLNRRSNNLARNMLAGGAKAHDKVAFYMRNRPEYTETFAACLRASLTHVNVNFRYREEELHYILHDSDAVAIVYASEFRDEVTALRARLDKIKIFIEVSDDGQIAGFAESFEDVAEAGDGSNLNITRSSKDELFIYTGGTTGMPKGVIWRSGDFYAGLIEASRAITGLGPNNVAELLAGVEELGRGSISLPACPLMHGTGFAGMLGMLMSGGVLVTLTNPHFDPDELWQTVANRKVERISIVGDAFARVMATSLEKAGSELDFSSLEMITSSGAMWSTDIKRRLLAILPGCTMADAFGASEGVGMGTSLMTSEGEVTTGRFSINDLARVFDDDGHEVKPGSDEEGWLAVGGPLPQGYYKDPEKSATVFKTFNGNRYAVPGDRCKVDADGGIIFLGRGSVCINTGGEKVFPEEVEEILKTHPSVDDALVVGVPDERWGQAVTAVITGSPELDEHALRDHVRASLAPYKIPKRVLASGVPLRAANGKADYASAKKFAIEILGA